ncbi:hypothetical protein TIFTF001_019113 [Ficus carica]|uniref:Mediator complex subunit 15 KIX domain-containing protein n=1 Tax=Ficus carica TaxID=3494 RepID=A0AA88DCB4_FICCA|nr:hypothetical protein TIFTF001_019113 [Ficus carica]
MPRRPNAAVPTLNLRARRVCANGGDWQQPFGMDNTDWKTWLQRGSRQRIVNKIMETLRKHLPFSGKEGLVELKQIAKRLNTRRGSSSIEDGVPGMDNSDWKAQLQPGSRQRIVNKIVEILRKRLPFSGKEGLVELKNIAKRFEEKMYTEATTQKISLKMLTMEKERSNSES